MRGLRQQCVGKPCEKVATVCVMSRPRPAQHTAGRSCCPTPRVAVAWSERTLMAAFGHRCHRYAAAGGLRSAKRTRAARTWAQRRGAGKAPSRTHAGDARRRRASPSAARPAWAGSIQRPTTRTCCGMCRDRTVERRNARGATAWRNGERRGGERRAAAGARDLCALPVAVAPCHLTGPRHL